jgi:hypothetical protein
MGTDIFCAYIKLEQLPDEVKTRHKIKVGASVPRFDLTRLAGYYKPLESMKNKKGQLVLYLNGTLGIIDSPDPRRADKFLMGKDSLYLSSVYLLDCSTPIDGGGFIGYGNPNRAATYGKGKKPNPFAECKDDGFLFLIAPDWKTIEMLVIPSGCNTILGNAKALADGVYNEALETMRAAAKAFFQY